MHLAKRRRSMKKCKLPIVCGALAILGGIPVLAQDRRLGIIGEDNRVPVTAQGPPWDAIGQVNIGGLRFTGQCTGTLVAPDIVLTAAHCVMDPWRKTPFPLHDIHFLAAVRGPANKGHSTAKCLHFPKDYEFIAPSDLQLTNCPCRRHSDSGQCGSAEGAHRCEGHLETIRGLTAKQKRQRDEQEGNRKGQHQKCSDHSDEMPSHQISAPENHLAQRRLSALADDGASPVFWTAAAVSISWLIRTASAMIGSRLSRLPGVASGGVARVIARIRSTSRLRHKSNSAIDRINRKIGVQVNAKSFGYLAEILWTARYFEARQHLL